MKKRISPVRATAIMATDDYAPVGLENSICPKRRASPYAIANALSGLRQETRKQARWGEGVPPSRKGQETKVRLRAARRGRRRPTCTENRGKKGKEENE
jgi:hypothetical protein